MNIKIKGLNPNETYCCFKEDVKSFFENDDIEINFGFLNLSRNENENSKYYRPKKNCQDRIVAKIVVRKRITDRFGLSCGSYLTFFILNKIYYTDDLRLKFVKEVLPQLKNFYEEHKDEKDYNRDSASSATVGLNDGNFYFYTMDSKK